MTNVQLSDCDHELPFPTEGNQSSWKEQPVGDLSMNLEHPDPDPDPGRPEEDKGDSEPEISGPAAAGGTNPRCVGWKAALDQGEHVLIERVTTRLDKPRSIGTVLPCRWSGARALPTGQRSPPPGARTGGGASLPLPGDIGCSRSAVAREDDHARLLLNRSPATLPTSRNRPVMHRRVHKGPPETAGHLTCPHLDAFPGGAAVGGPLPCAHTSPHNPPPPVRSHYLRLSPSPPSFHLQARGLAHCGAEGAGGGRCVQGLPGPSGGGGKCGPSKTGRLPPQGPGAPAPLLDNGKDASRDVGLSGGCWAPRYQLPAELCRMQGRADSEAQPPRCPQRPSSRPHSRTRRLAQSFRVARKQLPGPGTEDGEPAPPEAGEEPTCHRSLGSPSSTRALQGLPSLWAWAGSRERCRGLGRQPGPGGLRATTCQDVACVAVGSCPLRDSVPPGQPQSCILHSAITPWPPRASGTVAIQPRVAHDSCKPQPLPGSLYCRQPGEPGLSPHFRDEPTEDLRGHSHARGSQLGSSRTTPGAPGGYAAAPLPSLTPAPGVLTGERPLSARRSGSRAAVPGQLLTAPCPRAKRGGAGARLGLCPHLVHEGEIRAQDTRGRAVGLEAETVAGHLQARSPQSPGPSRRNLRCSTCRVLWTPASGAREDPGGPPFRPPGVSGRWRCSPSSQHGAQLCSAGDGTTSPASAPARPSPSGGQSGDPERCAAAPRRPTHGLQLASVGPSRGPPGLALEEPPPAWRLGLAANRARGRGVGCGTEGHGQPSWGRFRKPSSSVLISNS
ncbi:unnamed protein product [Nyctereutes procyonoides]|uniref:(raccoon dog) hypothetical protein n=1 Tax=Nyctereutes procyonoides TaxID=34880 RepID=A0A811ZIK4_NYCPR|nr:unnamed protein product [Nyctereutes procyonoides]